jgi:integrase
MSAKRKPKTRQKADAYLTDVRDQDGIRLGFRFTPGPALRQLGARPQSLKDAAGHWLSQLEARAARDRLLAAINAPESQAASLTPARQQPARAASFAPHLPKQAGPFERTIGNLWAAFELSLTQEGGRATRAADTVRFYRSMLKSWIDLSGPDCPVTDFTKDEIGEALDVWSAEGATVSTIAARFRGLQAALAYGERIGWIEASPARSMRVAKAAPRKRRASDEELSALINQADLWATKKNDASWAEVGTAIIAAVWTAQRQGDLLACRLDDQLITDAKTGKQRLTWRQAKTGAKVGPPLMAPLKARLGDRDTGPLIRGKDGQAWNKHTFRHAFAELRKAAKVQDLEFRDLRDTAITRLYEAGATAIQIATWSGHTISSVQQILEHYIDPQQSVADEVGDKLEAWAARGNVRY